MKQTSIFDPVSCGVARTVSYVTPMNNGHMHNKNELFFLVDGNMTAKCNNEIVTVKGPAVLIFASYSIHSGASLDDKIYDRYKLIFDDNILKSDFLCKMSNFVKNNPLTVITLDDTKKQILLSYFDRLNYHNSAAAMELLATWMLYELSCWQLIQCEPSPRSRTAYIHHVMQYLAENYQENITLEELAQRYYISRAKLVCDFKKQNGMTINEYISLIRINNAQNILKQGFGVRETAFMCGYADASYFIRKFTEYFGFTPGEYVRSLKTRNGRL
ncbi:MAG: helix-turn-helix transcriptional regulator [Clostridia bacterium]|nr:helix-turn-helix transcriptional regulator [Clostridia bacterium]